MKEKDDRLKRAKKRRVLQVTDKPAPLYRMNAEGNLEEWVDKQKKLTDMDICVVKKELPEIIVIDDDDGQSEEMEI